MIDRRGLLAAGTLLPFAAKAQGQAPGRAETLRCVMGGSVNSLDPVRFGATRESTGCAVHVADTLLRFGRKPQGAGFIFDYDRLEGALAERYALSADGLRITLHLRPGATWHDGSPVTAEDVKWSLDRVVGAQSMARAQAETGSMTSPEQFRVLGERVVEITLSRPDRMALPNLATIFMPMFNARLARQHATAADPWASEWLKSNSAAGGAYRVESFRPGEQLILRRNDDWRCGPRPYFRRVIVQTVPDAATRASLIERGDADFSLDLQSSDVIALERRGRVKVVQVPQQSIMSFLAFNTRLPPFDSVALRQAVAAALPYEDLFQAAVFGRGERLFGAGWSGAPAEPSFPQAMPFRTDLALARAKLAEAGFVDGLRTTLSFGVGAAQVNEPIATLVQEALGRIGIEVAVQKLPDAQMATAVTEKRLAMLIETSGAIFPATDYFFRIIYSGEQRWNFSSWRNPEVDVLAQEARFERDGARFQAMTRRMIALAATEVPLVPLWKPTLNAVMARNIEGFTYWFLRQPDFRDLSRSA
jgi:peptide/nickel transport system substrate-binding protein